MVDLQEVDNQLKNLGVTIKYWGRAEVKELANILMPGEHIKHCINGRYEGGFALLCATHQRMLLVDKKPFYLTVEDIRYDMISEVDYHIRLLDSTIIICTTNKTFQFLGFKQKALREMTVYIQNRVMEFRQQHMMQDSSEPVADQPPVLNNVQLQYQYPVPNNTSQPPIIATSIAGAGGVDTINHQVTNPYTRVPLMMRRRTGRFTG